MDLFLLLMKIIYSAIWTTWRRTFSPASAMSASSDVTFRTRAITSFWRPGFNKEDISLDLKENTLTISAVHKDQSEEKDEKNGYVRRERKIGSFSRSFDVSGIDVSKIDAEYTNGILLLHLPKKLPEPPASTTITIR